jgi:hypothetical protein
MPIPPLGFAGGGMSSMRPAMPQQAAPQSVGAPRGVPNVGMPSQAQNVGMPHALTDPDVNIAAQTAPYTGAMPPGMSALPQGLANRNFVPPGWAHAAWAQPGWMGGGQGGQGDLEGDQGGAGQWGWQNRWPDRVRPGHGGWGGAAPTAMPTGGTPLGGPPASPAYSGGFYTGWDQL